MSPRVQTNGRDISLGVMEIGGGGGGGGGGSNVLTSEHGTVSSHIAAYFPFSQTQ